MATTAMVTQEMVMPSSLQFSGKTIYFTVLATESDENSFYLQNAKRFNS